MSAFSGWKTYLVAGVCVALAVAELFGIQIPGLSATPGDLFIAAAGMFGLRSAIATK